ncbi:aldehyde dehydrogenase [Aeromicrobium ginsengisoli]|uniref:Aldehyde dehydrogenase n=1 Tax=Aeromicrobium ginsengisoli TaxID=363867 RepID=A0A5M4FAN2_9ACTN|nr:aldehyde dehydrogenase [Aeromicrobium ginsengisoli]KAA1394271.1 aldehyde dehydrogenase [Aeromicrobium ginsengisoli]
MTTLEHLWIDNAPHRPHGSGLVHLVNPATEQEIGTAPEADAADVDAAVQAANRALHDPAWHGLTPAGRAELLRALADAIDKRAAELAELITTQNGMPIKMVRWGNVAGTSASYRYFADLAEATPIEQERVTPYSRTRVRRDPIGAVGIIAPWNGPQILVAWKLGPALASGCTVVLKPAPETSLDAHLLAEAAADAGFPPGVFNVVTGGRETGAALVAHPGIAKIAFTGSTAAGREIAKVCGSQLKPATLELGGKSAAILLDDADLSLINAQVTRIFSPNSGQVCYSCTRVLAPRSRYDESVEAVVEGMGLARLGDPLLDTTNFGPLVSSRQRDRVEDYIGIGKNEGADVALGGGRPADLDRGFFVSPTVFRGVDNSMRIAREEIFGPVLVVIPYDDDDDAVRIANDSDYGLGGTVFTSDPERGLAIARRVETGTVGINGYEPTLDSPFGGVKGSGMGRELGPESLDGYVELKSIYNAPPL